MYIKTLILKNMRNNRSLIGIVNTIFDEIDQVSCITLECRVIKKESTEILKITSINGHPDGFSFGEWLKEACDRVARQFMMEQADFYGKDKELFTKYAINRCRQLSVYPVGFQPENRSRNLHLVIYGPKNSSSENRAMAVRFAGRYFIMRYHYLRDLADRLQMIVFLDQFSHNDEANMNITGDSSRLPTGFSVQLLAAFARILFESGFFKDTSKLRICRRFAGIFSTPRQKEISPRSFSNHFNQPDQPSLIQIGENLGKWMKIVEKLQSLKNDI
jgi:hypothetical protein